MPQLRASSLFYALIITLLSGLLISSFIALAYFNRLENYTYDLELRCTSNMRSGLELGKSLINESPHNSAFCIDLFGLQDDSVCVRTGPWGAYSYISSESSKNGFSVSRSQLVQRNMTGRHTLLLKDRNRPLTVSGSTQLNGHLLLPEAGIKRGYIDGQSYQGEQLINGSSSSSKSMDIPTNKALIQYAGNLVSKQFPDFEIIDFLDDTISHSFQENGWVYSSYGPISIDQKHLEGHLCVFSSASISVAASAMLDGILLVAPEVIFESGFTGSCQVIATDSVHLSSNSSLLEGSSIVMHHDQSDTLASFIVFESGSEMHGIVFDPPIENRYSSSRVIINKDAQVTGEITSHNHVVLNGTVNGRLNCSSFLLQTPSSIYENHLLSGQILQNQHQTLLPSIEGSTIQLLSYEE